MKKLLLTMLCITFFIPLASALDITGGVDSITAGPNITVSPVGGSGRVTVSGSSGTVSKLTAGTNITLTPVGGTGDVTVTGTTFSTSTVLAIKAGSNITVTPADGAGGDVTISATGGSLPETTTFYYTMIIGGDMAISTATFNATSASGIVPAITTWTITSIQAFVSIASTVTVTDFRIAHTTSTGADIYWQYITPAMQISTNTKASNEITTLSVVSLNTLNAQNQICGHITSVGIGGIPAAEAKIVIKGWRKND